MDRLQKLLKNKGVQFDIGLSKDEINQIEIKFNVKFPSDLKQFLKFGLPISDGFVNWRQGLDSKDAETKIVSRLDWPLDGTPYRTQDRPPPFRWDAVPLERPLPERWKHTLPQGKGQQVIVVPALPFLL